MQFNYLSAIVAIILSATCASAQTDARPAKVFMVKQTESVVRRSYPAIILPSKEVELSFRVSGRVVELPVRGAMDVREGDMIARLDSRDFETQVAQLESQRDQAEAQLRALRLGARPEEIAALEAGVASAQAQVDQAREQAARTRELAQRGVVSSARLEQDDASLRVAEANLRAQQESLIIGQSGGRTEDIEASEAALRGIKAQLQIAENNLEYATLNAPFAGVVARRDIENFTNIQAGQTVALVQALDVLHLAFDVPGPDVTALTSRGTEAVTTRVTFDAIPGQVFGAEVVEFSLQADSATQTYRGRVAVTVPQDRVILPGMIGRVTAEAPGDAPEMKIPLSAVGAAADGAPIVWRLSADNTVSQVAVELGEPTGGMVVVTRGLAPGDVVISAGVSQILDGMTVRPITNIGG